MSEVSGREPTTGAAASLPPLAELVAEAVRATPGVVRLEPSMKNSMSRLMARGTPTVGRPGTGAGAVDGVVLSSRDGLTTALVDIATDTDHAAAAVADAVQRTVHELLVSHAHRPGAVSVSVLSVE